MNTFEDFEMLIKTMSKSEKRHFNLYTSLISRL